MLAWQRCYKENEIICLESSDFEYAPPSNKRHPWIICLNVIKTVKRVPENWLL